MREGDLFSSLVFERNVQFGFIINIWCSGEGESGVMTMPGVTDVFFWFCNNSTIAAREVLLIANKYRSYSD